MINQLDRATSNKILEEIEMTLQRNTNNAPRPQMIVDDNSQGFQLYDSHGFPIEPEKNSNNQSILPNSDGVSAEDLLRAHIS